MTNAPALNGAQSLVSTLLGSGVDICFSNPGTSEMHFVSALDEHPQMRCVLALFEGVATGAADGYFRMARRPAATLLHLGPGLGNGIANLHNAKKARSGLVNVVGEHAIDHLALDAPLTADIEGLARPVSHWVKTSRDAATVGADGAEAVARAMSAAGQVATLILPGDTAWNPGGVVAAPVDPDPRADFNADALDEAAAALDGPGTMLLLGGEALSEDGLRLAGQIVAKTGCRIQAEVFNARWRRGAGRVALDRIPYPVQLALETLKDVRRLVLVGARAPVGFFAYPNMPGRMTAAGTQIVDLAPAEADLLGALDALAQAVGATAPAVVAPLEMPGAPSGPVTPEAVSAVLARTIPENAIVVDESISTGAAHIQTTMTAQPHDWLVNRGGSIGLCLPMALGAALACPDRKVIALSGDGSAMYTPQALWSMAREGADITVLIFSNRSYKILLGEFDNVGVQNPGPRAMSMMTLDRPDLNFVDMARGMGVAATAVEDAAALERAVLTGLAEPGPYLIEVIL